MQIEIRRGRIIDPAIGLDITGSIYINKGKILSVGERPKNFKAEKIIDARQQIICPGLIDLSARLREPGQTHKATIASETRAALSAGFTSLCIPPDTQPVTDTPAVAELIREKAELADFPQLYPIGALTHKLEGRELSAMHALKNEGCIAVSNAEAPIHNMLIMKRAMEYASSHDMLMIYRPNEHALSNNGCAHEGAHATRFGLPGIPDTAETIALAQCLELVGQTGCRVHFSHISCARAVAMLTWAKVRQLPISADTAIHQLHLTETAIQPFNSAYHVIPPFRTDADRRALLEGIRKGVINAVCSDHQPHDIDAKLGAFPETEPGVSALETVLPLMLKLVNNKALTLSQGIAALTSKPADILGLKRGALAPGMEADVCIFDPDEIWKVDQSNWQSLGQNTPFWGESMQGKVTHTLLAGKIVYSR